MPSIIVHFKICEKQLGYTDYRGEFIVGEVQKPLTKKVVKALLKEFIRELKFYVRQKREKETEENVQA